MGLVEFARAVSLGNLDIISTSSSTGRHLPSCSCDSQRRLSEEYLAVVYVKLYTDPEVVAPCALENLDLLYALLVSGNHSLPDASVWRLLDKFHAFSM